METVEIQVYSIDELDGAAQENALDWMCQYFDFAWHNEYRDSLQAFCGELGISVPDWSAGAWNNFHYTPDRAEWNQAMRGRKLSEFDRDHMPTGFCADCDLWMTFYDAWKRTGSPVDAVESALDAFFKAWAADIEDHYSDERMLENAEVNEYRFTKSGEFFS